MGTESNAVKTRQAVERRIVKQFIKELLAQGFFVAIDNGGDSFEFPPTNNEKTLVDGIMATDEEHLYVFRDAEQANAKRHMAWAFFVYGNDGFDVLANHSGLLEPLIPETMKLINKLGG